MPDHSDEAVVQLGHGDAHPAPCSAAGAACAWRRPSPYGALTRAGTPVCEGEAEVIDWAGRGRGIRRASRLWPGKRGG
jgi:hypothetical protein